MTVLEYEKYTARREKEAGDSYNSIRECDDIAVISKNTGFSNDQITQIKNHVFFNKHILYDGFKRFPADYDMAVAWRRMTVGTPLDRDILLLNHELLESTYEKSIME